MKIIFRSIIPIIILFFAHLNVHSQWIQLNGPSGGYVRYICASDSVLYAIVNSNRIYVSENNGINWEIRNNGLYEKVVSSIMQYKTRLFAVTDSGLYVSESKGALWIRNTILNKTIPVSCITQAGNLLFAGTVRKGIFLSNDDGNNWKPINNGLPLNVISCILADSNKIYAGILGKGVYYSADTGKSWLLIDSGLTSSYITSLVSNGESVFAGSDDQGVFVLDNNNQIWKQVNNGFTVLTINSMCTSGTNIFVAGKNGVYISIDNGNNWNKINNGLENWSIISISSNNTNIFAGTSDGGIYKSNLYGANWIATGLPTQCVHALFSSGSLLYTGTHYGVYYSEDSGENWTKSDLIYTTPLKIIKVNSDLFAATDKGVFTSKNDGLNWSSVNNIFFNEGTTTINYLNDKLFVSTHDNRIFVSTDFGNNWIRFGDTFPSYIWCISEYHSDIYVATDYGLYKINLEGNNKILLDNGLANRSIYDILIKDNRILLGTDSGIFVSDNYSANWFSSGLGDQLVYKIIDYNNYLIAGTLHGGVFISEDMGKSWNSINDGFYKQTQVLSMYVYNNYLYVGSGLQGLWRRKLSEVVGINNPANPKTTVLLQNYPNPFNSNTTIIYTNTKDGFVSMDIYDNYFRKIESMIFEYQPAGEYRIIWNGSDYPAGVYFVKLNINGASEVRRIILIK